MSTNPRSRAAAVLGVPPDAKPADAVAAFLGKLPAAEFAPPSERVAAVGALAGAAAPFDPDDAPGLTADDAVADFTRRFWSLSYPDRTAEWMALSRFATEDAAAARLLALQPGLDVWDDPPLDPSSQELAALIRELFVMPLRERAIRRNEWLVANAARHEEFVRAAVTLRWVAPALVALDPHLDARLDPQFDANGFVAAVTAPTAKPIDLPPGEGAIPDWLGAPKPQPTRGRSTPGDGAKGMGCVVMGLIWVIIKLVGGIGSSTTSPSTLPSIRPYTPPRGSEPPPTWKRPDPISGFSDEDVYLYRVYDRSHFGRVPPGYSEWVLNGKPDANQPLRKLFNPKP